MGREVLDLGKLSQAVLLPGLSLPLQAACAWRSSSGHEMIPGTWESEARVPEQPGNSADSL